MIRPAGEVEGAAAGADRALAAGVPPLDVVFLVAGRHLWRTGCRIPVDVIRAARHPGAPAFDEVFVAAMRRLGGA